MISVLDYITTDKFINLFITNTRFLTAYKHTSVITIHKSYFEPDVINLFGDELGIPDSISCTNPYINVVDGGLDGGLDGERSFSCDNMIIVWGSERTQSDLATCVETDASPSYNINKHRVGLPASINIRNFITSHNHGNMTGFTVSKYCINWYQNNLKYRASGPHTVQSGMMIATVDTHNVIRTLRKPNFIYEWDHPSDGSRLSQNQIDSVLKHHDITINLLSPTHSVFVDQLDEMAFYSSF